MSKTIIYFALLLCLAVTPGYAQKGKRSTLKEWTGLRSQLISNVSYDLSFYIPSLPSEKVTGMAIVTFFLSEKTEMALDFQGRFTGTFIINDKKRNFRQENGHIVIPMKYTRPGANRVAISFESTENALKRHDEYIYSCFSKNQASTCFPCFDQPDIQATFVTHLNLPEGWIYMASNNHSPISTSQYSFIAGRFNERTTQYEGHILRMFYRKQDVPTEDELSQILQESAQSLRSMENYTALPYPFDENCLLLLPNPRFQSIEYPGAIRLTDNHIFVGENPTQEAILKRRELIAHETAHLWFGCMTPMQSPNDVWAKELFANYLVKKTIRQHHSKPEADLFFLATHQKRALAEGNTTSTHAISQPQPSTDHWSISNDAVINDKGAVMMRFLEDLIGEKAMQTAIQAFLRKHFFKHASWEDFLNILEKQIPNANIRQFCNAWLKNRIIPVIHTTYRDGNLLITQEMPNGNDDFLPQKFEVRTIYDFGISRTVTVEMNEPRVCIKLKGRPNFIIPNYDGRGYGHFTMDEAYTSILPLRLIVTHNDLNRFALLQNVHDNYLRGAIPPSYFGELYRDMVKEKNPLIMYSAVDHMMKIASDLTLSERMTLEQCIMDVLKENHRSECRQIIIR